MARRYSSGKNDPTTFSKDNQPKVNRVRAGRQDNYPKQTEPKRPKKKSSPLLNILLVVFILVFLGSAGYLVNEMVIKPYYTDSTLSEVQTDIPDIGVSETEEIEEIINESGEIVEVLVNDTVKSVRKLKEKYPDMVGWIKIPNTDVHFPVVQSSTSDPEYYLYRNYKGEDTKYGSIFMESTNSIEGDIQILYGHSMLDGRMFYKLVDFDKLEVYKESPVIQYDTYEEAGKWKIVSVFKTNTRYDHGEPFGYIVSGFSSTEEKMDFVYNCMIRSTINTGVDIQQDDRFILLSTCSYEYDDFRTVVVARKVRADESDEVNVNSATVNENALYPDVWYSSASQIPSYPSTFAEAKEQGLTPWFSE